jgi:hypothetical protein
MNTRDFLEQLLPPSGWIFTATQTPGSKGWINYAHQSLDDAVKNINHLTFENKPAYFALASYKQDRVWNPDFKKRDGTLGKWMTRTQDNTQDVRSFFLDLDIDPADAGKFPDKPTALAEFEQFRIKVGLPRPMIVDSGGGYHIYWPLITPVPAAQWRIAADRFKAICQAEVFKADRSLTSDQARVLRAVGGFNTRRGKPVVLLQQGSPIDFGVFKDILNGFVTSVGLQLPRSKPTPDLAGTPAAVGGMLGDNLGATNEPLQFDRIAFHCAQLGIQTGSRGEFTGEKLWRAALGIAKFCEPQDLAYRSISDAHADYDEHKTIIKIENWRTGPTACEHFHTENPATCETCPHWQKITSPAQLGKLVRTAAPPQVEVVDIDTGLVTTIVLPDPPSQYRRRKDGAVLVLTEDGEGEISHVVICEYDLYPVRIMRQSGEESGVDERSIWRAHLPRIGVQDMELPQSLMSDGRKLHAFLLGKGVYMNPEQAKAIQFYMSAYLQKLAAEADREKLYERMGWHGPHKEFVLGDVVLTTDGKSHPHSPSRSVRAVTKDGVKPSGTLSAWIQAMQFYTQEGMAAHRFFIYCALGSPLFHMNDVGNKGILINANGLSGRGKTTCLKACSSVWGAPEALVMNGNKDGSTTNALYEAIGTFHSLPFMWDDITEREPDELRRFLLNISQGTGKVRMKDGQGLSERRLAWQLMVLASANTDVISNILASGKDVDPHLMRMVTVDFDLLDAGPKAKARADNFMRAINANNGHAGPAFMKVIMQNYDKIRRGLIENTTKVDNLLNSRNAAAERYWSSAVATAYTAALVAKNMGLLPLWPIEDDLKWMVQHMINQRTTITDGRSTPLELLSEFLEASISSTLTLSAKGASNLDNVVIRPHGPSLTIRYDIDNHTMFVARAAIMDYCAKHKTPFKQLEAALEKDGVIVNRTALKVLGADTMYAKGQSRCWKIETNKLGPAVVPAAVTPTNVVPITGGKAA